MSANSLRPLGCISLGPIGIGCSCSSTGLKLDLCLQQEVLFPSPHLLTHPFEGCLNSSHQWRLRPKSSAFSVYSLAVHFLSMSIASTHNIFMCLCSRVSLTNSLSKKVHRKQLKWRHWKKKSTYRYIFFIWNFANPLPIVFSTCMDSSAHFHGEKRTIPTTEHLYSQVHWKRHILIQM